MCVITERPLHSRAIPILRKQAMSNEMHPLLVPNGFQISTKPTESLANFILQNVEEDHHGVPSYGAGGLGKTSAQEYLTQHVSQWLSMQTIDPSVWPLD